jgi:lipoate-protein ligase A
VLLGEHKICGSAQRRWRGAILQHGSLLVDASPAAPELPGIRQLGAPNFDQARFIDVWRTTLARRLEFSWQPAELSTSEREEATRLADEKFATSEWNHRR